MNFCDAHEKDQLSHDQAQDIVGRMHKRGESANAYKCPDCKKWHVSSVKARAKGRPAPASISRKGIPV